MRRTAVAIALVLVATLGIIVPSVAAATGDPKVVIVVGATHGATAGYRADADIAYAEAKKYTPNVVKVYSPNATWAKVKAAAAGAAVLIYLGHGNGWPSPYTYDPLFTTKDGFGLNATAGAGDYNTKYYGEPSIATLDLAPGALVILNHLCYASGNAEPGDAEPSIAVARQRADNYAAAFLKAGAGAVIAEGHAGSERYLRPLFTTHRSIEDLWRAVPVGNGHIVSFASIRTPGAMVFQDPITPTSGFYRSLAVGTLGLTTDEVLSAGYGDTGADPASLVVPGNASVSTADASLFGSPDPTTASARTLPAGTRLHVVDQPTAVTAEATALVEVAGIDDPSITGFMVPTDLLARDSAPPVVQVLDPGPPFSPNGDGQGDSATLRGRFTESVAWKLQVKDGGGRVLLQKTGTGSTFSVTWDGLVNGARVADGSYTVSVSGVDAWANAPASTSRTVTVDTVAPVLTTFTPASGTALLFTPNGDRVGDSVTFSATNSEIGAVVVRVIDAGAHTVATWIVPSGSAATDVTWDGRTTSGAYAPDGAYTLRVAPRDVAGNTGQAADRSVTLIGAVRSIASSAAIFFPQDLDTLSQNTTLSFVLKRPMTVTWTVRHASGTVVNTQMDGVDQPAGTYTWAFDGRAADGTMLPGGRYGSFVTATDGTLTVTQAVWFTIDAFTIKSSDTTPKRGQSITISVRSAEALIRTPTLYVYQPGLVAWHLRMTRTGTYTYKATIRLKSTGKTGQVSFKVKGTDVKGGTQSTKVGFPLH